MSEITIGLPTSSKDRDLMMREIIARARKRGDRLVGNGQIGSQPAVKISSDTDAEPDLRAAYDDVTKGDARVDGYLGTLD